MSVRVDLEQTAAEAVERDGFVIVPDALAPELVRDLSEAVARAKGTRAQGYHAREGVYALRNLFAFVPEARNALHSPALRDVVGGVLGREAFCVRGLFLDTTPRANWSVPWHQDATITVKERAEVTGFGSWTMKGGVQHVMAPPGTLSAMLTVRLHLDDCATSEGAVSVVTASHQFGRLPVDSIEQFTRYDVTTCPVAARGLMAMRPLLLRCSSAATRPGFRRVIQLDFAARRLPLPLEWREAYAVFES